MKYREKAKKIIFVFLVMTVVSSLSAVAFVTPTMNLVFAKKSSDGGGGSSKDKGGGSSGGDKGGGSEGSGGGGSSDTTGSETTTAGSDTSNTGGGNSDTGSTSTPPSTTEETTPPPAAEENTGASPPPPAAEGQQTTCPDGSTPDENGKCPTTTLAPNQSPPAAQDGGHILVMSNPDGSCPAGSHKFPGSQVCEKDTVPPTSGSGGTGGTTTTQPGGTSTGTTPATTQGGHILVMSNPDGSCPAGSHKFPGSQVCEKDTTATTPSAGEQVPPECQGIIAGPKDKCSSSPATSPINGAPQTITQQTCPPLPIDENGRCPGIDARGGGLGLPPPPPQPTPLGDGSFQLPTVPAVPNTNSIAPICPSGSHLELNKCVVDGVQCPSGTVQDGDKCTPSSDGSAAAGGAQPRPTCGPDAPGAACQAAKAAAGCPQSATLDANGKCTGPGGLPLPQRTCPAGSNLDPTTGNCNPTTGGNTASQYVSAVNGKCPAGSHEAGGSSGNAGQPGTGSIICRLDSPPPATPPATPPTNTPPLQPQATQQLTPSQPECEPGFHWDISQLKCV